MFVIGGSLKRKEKLSARLGDVLSYLYLSSCALKFYDERGQQKDELPILKWALYDCAFKIQVAMDGILKNFPNRFVAWFLSRLVFPKGMTLIQPSDDLGHDVAKILITPSAARDRLIAGMYLPDDESDIMGQLNAAMNAVIAAEPVEAKVRTAQKSGRITAKVLEAIFDEAKELSVITETELALWKRARVLTIEVVRVDDFDMNFGLAVARSASHQIGGYAEAAE